MTEKLRLHIHTMGCQMNVYDSEQMAATLIPLGYDTTDTLEKADVIILNTCSIRDKSEQKVYSYLGRLSNLKRAKPHLIIAVGGCVAQQEGRRMLKRVPHLDMVFGTHAVGRLPGLIRKVASTGRRIVDTDMADIVEELPAVDYPRPDGRASRFVTIMRGCDNFCTYCVVPYVRGREFSRSPEAIEAEIRGLVRSGVREVTLLGQNVNSYGKKQQLCSFAQLLARVNTIEGLYRIRFTTSHPRDLSDELIRAFTDLDKLCRHIHLPVQSGSDRVLERMNRKYTREIYLEKVRKLREACPDIAISSDFIAGFPGETEDDFEQTLDLIRQVGFDGLFAFTYSDRPNAPAARFTGKISETEKRERLRRLLALQEKITREKNRQLIGSVQEILVDGPSKKQEKMPQGKTNQPRQWTGRTSANKIVNFFQGGADEPGCEIIQGTLLDVRIDKAFSHSLWGKPLDTESDASGSKGESCYAA